MPLLTRKFPDTFQKCMVGSPHSGTNCLADRVRKHTPWGCSLLPCTSRCRTAAGNPLGQKTWSQTCHLDSYTYWCFLKMFSPSRISYRKSLWIPDKVMPHNDLLHMSCKAGMLWSWQTRRFQEGTECIPRMRVHHCMSLQDTACKRWHQPIPPFGSRRVIVCRISGSS